jgi:hypothetical protein
MAEHDGLVSLRFASNSKWEYNSEDHQVMEVEPFCDEFAPREWERFERHRIEFAVSMRTVHEFLPKPPGLI